MIGSRIAIGTPTAVPKEPYVMLASGANTITAMVASVARMPMLAISQNPERVSNILRSSTLRIRLSGTPGPVVSIVSTCGWRYSCRDSF